MILELYSAAQIVAVILAGSLCEMSSVKVIFNFLERFVKI